MRVAVRHTDTSHPNAHWFAFEQGRILGFTDPISGQSYSAEQVAEALLARAREQFPAEEGYEHRVETLHQAEESGEGEWHQLGSSDLPRAGSGGVHNHELTIQRDQEASAG